MLKIIESLIEDPIRFPTDPEAQFIPGQVGQINYESMICEVSNGLRPFGLIDDIKTDLVDSTERGLVSVWSQRMVFRTDQYDAEGEYETGVTLYVNYAGFLTSFRNYEDETSVARVISVMGKSKESGKEIIECVWF